jgi:hypothetical protein
MVQGGVMTEAEWLTSRNIFEAFLFLKDDHIYGRKWSLFCCNCLRRVWPILHDDRVREYVAIYERNADREFNDEQELKAAWAACSAAFEESPEEFASNKLFNAFTEYPLWLEPFELAKKCAEVLGRKAVDERWPIWGRWTNEKTSICEGAISQEEIEQQRLRLDIFGNPFRPVVLDPRWQTSTVLDLARLIYEERAFDRLPILADALMDAGCDNDDILAHCRGNGPHVRGCWVIDLILGKQ